MKSRTIADPDLLTEYETHLLSSVGDRIVYTVLSNPLSYSAAIAFARCDRSLGRPGGVVIYELSGSTIIDRSSALAIGEMVELSQRNGRYVILSGAKGDRVSTLNDAGVFALLTEPQRFELRRNAIEAAVDHCRAHLA